MIILSKLDLISLRSLPKLSPVLDTVENNGSIPFATLFSQKTEVEFCGSASISNVLSPSMAILALRLRLSVVLPLPPFKENKILESIAEAKRYVAKQEKRKRDEGLAKAKAKEQERKELERQKALLQEQIYKSRQIQIKNYITQRSDYEQRTNRIKPATLCRYRNLHISNFGNFADKSNGSIRQLPASRDNSMRIVSKFNMDFRLRKSNMLLSDNSQHNLRHTEQSKNNLYVRQQGDINQADTTTRALTTSKKIKKEIQSFER